MSRTQSQFGVSFQAVGRSGSGVWIVRVHDAPDGTYGDPYGPSLVIEQSTQAIGNSPGCLGYAMGKHDGDKPVMSASQAERLLRALACFGFDWFRWERIKHGTIRDRDMDLRNWRADA